jgi:hypothetical protein
MGTWPMWLQSVIILGVFGIVVGFVMAIIYKIIKADKIKVSSIEIDEHDEPEKVETKTETTKESKI